MAAVTAADPDTGRWRSQATGASRCPRLPGRLACPAFAAPPHVCSFRRTHPPQLAHSDVVVLVPVPPGRAGADRPRGGGLRAESIAFRAVCPADRVPCAADREPSGIRPGHACRDRHGASGACRRNFPQTSCLPLTFRSLSSVGAAYAVLGWPLPLGSVLIFSKASYCSSSTWRLVSFPITFPHGSIL